jgi:hypothetical protein
VVAVITVATLGVGLIFLLAGVVGVIDAMRAATWRRVAAERRMNWEARHQAPTYRESVPSAGR